MTRLVIVDVPKDNKKRLGLPSGKEKPDSICRGTMDDSSVDLLMTSIVGSLDQRQLKFILTHISLI
jgi:hypothetical protein